MRMEFQDRGVLLNNAFKKVDGVVKFLKLNTVHPVFISNFHIVGFQFNRLFQLGEDILFIFFQLLSLIGFSLAILPYKKKLWPNILKILHDFREDIKVGIETYVKGKYRAWKIGLTSEPGEARRRNGNPLTWLEWEIYENLGLDIVNYFQKKGMNLAVETAPEETTHLYITL